MQRQPLHLTTSAYDRLIAACREALPREACGIMTGEPDTGKIVDVTAIANVHPSPATAFAFAPDDWVKAYYRMQKSRQSLLGFFHSHPTSPPHPSTADELGIHSDDLFLSYWIISLQQPLQPELQVFYYMNGCFQPARWAIAD
ncbi:Proteasome lid subunit RPN8/RPN11, contains Jab1/MPN metalloenzyme (JAMM) motif [Paenibacillus algorifonticola]|uniref:Proteasome lid subunit RPN8/RPN11, contains Jab1/MPN metalloenzyme (JAMM) motif n=1 Tax=Paenibacillus algorifonticola TaxID=684063 RepID=A0A1I1ZZL2_9BACL|nr:M67 family metallopeptidase [Paenibacillus algorifonticola]SFE36937.1 Proteasome lid subunit RPN8/RPN11, contains Jab1/MPN metalloenzyme (JAMM) motif [Paenibacillus algorifonticola]